MNSCEYEYGVRLGWTIKYEGRDITLHSYYAGRDESGKIKTDNNPGVAAMMTEEVAKRLIEKFKDRYPKSEVIELIRGERDELTATSLEQLGEIPLPQLRLVVRECLDSGISLDEVLSTCRAAVAVPG